MATKKMSYAQERFFFTLYSSALDCYLTAAMPNNKPSFEMIDKECRDFNGHHYYSDKNRMQEKIDVYTEKSFNAVFAAKVKQGR